LSVLCARNAGVANEFGDHCLQSNDKFLRSTNHLEKTIIKEPYQCLTAISNIHTTL